MNEELRAAYRKAGIEFSEHCSALADAFQGLGEAVGEMAQTIGEAVINTTHNMNDGHCADCGADNLGALIAPCEGTENNGK